jgi:predicted nucleic acid-binding protein
VKYLLDANILLEASLRRAHWEKAVEFLRTTPANQLAVADFSLHSMGFFLVPKTPRAFDAIITDVLTRGISILQLPPTQLARVTSVSEAQRLDFDDAFVYTIAEDHDLIIVSFDADFDHTARGRKTPEALLSAT